MMRRLLLAAVLASLQCAAPWARADFTIPGFELVQTVPLETSLGDPDVRDSTAVWSQLFDGARSEIAIGQFYVAGKAGTPFEQVIERLEAAGRRGVKIRFLLDVKGIGLSEAATVERLRAIPNLEMRHIDFSKRSANGIVHAKYLVVDRKSAFVGSQNFDWRAFAHIFETGLLVTDPATVRQVLAVFESDWHGKTVRRGAPAGQLVASPAALNPPGVPDSQRALPALLASATREIRIQLLDYVPLTYAKPRAFYPVIDNAVRAAAARGVSVKLMVSHWNLEKPGVDYLKSLAMLPNVQVRIVTLPTASTGFIPYARVIHSKTMSIDGQLAWVGTSNWGGGYLDSSRNLEIVLRSEKMAQRLARQHEQAWTSAYAQPLDINKDYPSPNKGSEK